MDIKYGQIQQDRILETMRQKLIAEAEAEAQRTGRTSLEIRKEMVANNPDWPEYVKVGVTNKYKDAAQIYETISAGTPNSSPTDREGGFFDQVPGVGGLLNEYVADPISDVVKTIHDTGGDIKDWVKETGDDLILTEPEKQKIIDEMQADQLEGIDKAIDAEKEGFDRALEMTRPQREIMDRVMLGMEEGINDGKYAYDPFEFDESKYPVEFQFDESKYQMPDDFSFTYDDFEKTPFYDFLQEEGGRQIERSAAARGGLNSGGTMAALQNRGQQIAGAEFQNQYNRAEGTYDTNYGKAFDNRNFGLGLAKDQYGRAIDDRNYGYGLATDRHTASRNRSLDAFNQASTLAGLGSGAFQAGVGANKDFTSAMSNANMNIGNVGAAAGAARMNVGYSPFDWLNLGAQFYGARP